MPSSFGIDSSFVITGQDRQVPQPPKHYFALTHPRPFGTGTPLFFSGAGRSIPLSVFMRLRLAGVVVLILAAAAPSVRAQRLQLPTRMPQSGGVISTQFTPNTSAPTGSTYLPGGTTVLPSSPAFGTAPPTTSGGSPQHFDPYSTTRPQHRFPTRCCRHATGAPPTWYDNASTAGRHQSARRNGAPSPYFTPAPAGVPYTTSPPAIYPNGLPPMVPRPFPAAGCRTSARSRGSCRRSACSTNGCSRTTTPTRSKSIRPKSRRPSPFPVFGLQTPFLITPGFGLHYIRRARSRRADIPRFAAATYDAFLDVGWNPQVNNWFGAELGVRTGVYTDFDHFSTDSFRIMGRGIGVVRITPTLAGEVWASSTSTATTSRSCRCLASSGIRSPDAHYEIVFPRPKLARRWITLGQSQSVVLPRRRIWRRFVDDRARRTARIRRCGRLQRSPRAPGARMAARDAIRPARVLGDRLRLQP